jgi:integrase/recombinase XerD
VRFRRDKKIGVSVGSANSYLQYAKAAFSTLQSEGYLEENVWEALKNIKRQQEQVDTLSEDEIMKMLNVLDRTWYADFRAYVLLHTLLDTFGRITEVLSVKKKDIDYQNASITFQQTKNNLFRIVPITTRTLDLLEQLIRETEEFESEYIFLTNTGKPLVSGTVRKQLREIAEKAGVKRRIYPHLFRHTAFKMFLEQGGSMRVLQKILGHRDIQTTMIYSHVFDTTIKNQHEQFSPIKHLDEKQGYKTRTNKKGRLKRH